MKRPYVICHMVTSIDGLVTGDFLFNDACLNATELYYKINRELKADGFACGRITMEGSFTGGYYPDLTDCEPCSSKEDFISPYKNGFYAVSFDRQGRLGWKSCEISDDDPGYGGAHIIEVLSSVQDTRYLTYLRKIGVSYIFADTVSCALEKLRSLFGISTLLLEGGSIINGAFLAEGLIDELSLVVAPLLGSRDGKPLFFGSDAVEFKLIESKPVNSSLWLRYKKIISEE